MPSLTWLRALVTRQGARVVATAAGVAVAVALFASIGAFLAASKATMTRRAVQSVTVDWQVEVQPNASTPAILRAVRSRATATATVGVASTTGLQARTGGSTQATGPGVVLGLPSRYPATFPGVIRRLAGTPSGVLVTQQTAANLHVTPGDPITIGRDGLPVATVRVQGVVDLPQADSLFQRVGAPPGSQPQAPPDNVVLLPAPAWHTVFDPLAARRPDLVHTQIHARLPRDLPADPAAAFTRVDGAAHNLEASVSGGALVGDNLGATLSAARDDALYAQVLFLFLGVPGIALAALLTAAVARSGAQRRRREQALVRTRGATPALIVRFALAEALVVGGLGAVLGIGAALAVGATSFGDAGFGATGHAAAVWFAAAAAVGLGIAVAVIVVPTWLDSRRLTVARARLTFGAERAPRWLRGGLDLLLLAAAYIVFWLTSRNGYQLVLAPEGTPAISVSYWALAGPALLWLGAGLLAWRLAYWGLAAGRAVVTRVIRPVAGGLSGTVAATMARQRRLLAGALALVALSVAFAGSTAGFNRTYRTQAEVDAQLTNGGDVTVSEAPGSTSGPSVARLAAIHGVRRVEPLVHRYAYVGADLQDLYGVRTSTIVDATHLQDAYFQGGSARSLITRLGRQPDGVLVSAETVKDFQLRPGDPLHLRLPGHGRGSLVQVPFHYVGIAKEFPTAPRDSFLVANASYVAARTGNPAIGAYLIDTGGRSTATVAHAVRRYVGPTATVTDLATTRKVVGSSLTAVDLSGLTKVELGFAIVLAVAAAGLVLGLGLAERRRTFAIAAALGARPAQLGGFVWSEAGFVLLGGVAAGGCIGWALAAMLVKVLTGVFDPPPDHLSVPWGYLATVAAAVTAAVAVAAAITVRRAASAPLTELRDL
ncbi:MAG TPA: ABC transporter permease [Acidimicrobiia bacterium]